MRAYELKRALASRPLCQLIEAVWLALATVQQDARTPEERPRNFCDWKTYTTDFDSFTGDSGAGVFIYTVTGCGTGTGTCSVTDVKLIGMLISGATDYITRASDRTCNVVNQCSEIRSGVCEIWNPAARCAGR